MLVGFSVLGPLSIMFKTSNIRVDWLLITVSSLAGLIVTTFGFAIKSRSRSENQKWRSPSWHGNPFAFQQDPVQVWHAGAWNTAALGIATAVYSILLSPADILMAALEISLASSLIVGIRLWQLLFPKTVDAD